MKLKTRITGALFCLLIYAGAVALALYNASRFKESVNLDGEHLYTNWFSVYGIPGLRSLDGLDVLSASIWPALLILPLLLFFLLKRKDVNRLNKSLIGIGAILLVKSYIYDIWLSRQSLVPEFDWGGGAPLYEFYRIVLLCLSVIYSIMLLIWLSQEISKMVEVCSLNVKPMSIGIRIWGVLLCLFLYAGGVVLDLYNAARLKDEPPGYIAYDIPEVHCIDGVDIFASCVGLALLLLPLLLYFVVKRGRMSGWHKILLWYGCSFFICQFIRNIWITTQELVPDVGFIFFLVLWALYVIMLLMWPIINMFTVKRVG